MIVPDPSVQLSAVPYYVYGGARRPLAAALSLTGAAGTECTDLNTWRGEAWYTMNPRGRLLTTKCLPFRNQWWTMVAREVGRPPPPPPRRDSV